GAHALLDDLVPRVGEARHECAARLVVARAVGDAVGDGQHLGARGHDAAVRMARAAAAGSSAPKMPVPDTRMSTPASAASAALSTLMPPSISISTSSPRASISLRATRTLSSTSGMKGWPPKPVCTL